MHALEKRVRASRVFPRGLQRTNAGTAGTIIRTFAIFEILNSPKVTIIKYIIGYFEHDTIEKL